MTYRKIKIFLLSIFAAGACFSAAAQDSDRKELENELVKAVEKIELGKLQEGKQILEGIIARDPGMDAAHFYLGLTRLYERDSASAVNELREAVSLDPSNFWYRQRLARVYSMIGEKELTLAMYEALVKDFPDKYDLYYDMVDLYMESGQKEKALETVTQIEEVFGKTEMTAMSKFEILRDMDRIEEGYEVLEEYNSEFSSPQIITVLADRKLALYDEDGAMAMYDEALDLYPGYVPALLGKADVYRMRRQYDEFFDTLHEFLKDEVLTVEAKTQYLNALISSSGQNFTRIFQPQLDSLMLDYESLAPGDSTVNFTLGRYYYSTGRKGMAEEKFLQNYEKYPQSLSAASNYLEILMYTDKWENLSVEAGKCYDKFPQEPDFLEIMAMAEYHLENYGRVISIYEDIVKAAPGDSTRVLQAYASIGDMHYKLGDKKKAYKSYDKALKINPDYAHVLNNYAYYLSLDGKKLKKACTMSKKTVDQEPDNSTYLDTYGWILHLMGKSAEAKPILKNAIMLYGGKENPEILDHYAEVLFSLGEYDLAMLYWNQALSKNNGDVEDLQERVALRKSQMNQKKK